MRLRDGRTMWRVNVGTVFRVRPDFERGLGPVSAFWLWVFWRTRMARVGR